MNYTASIFDFFKSPKWPMNMLCGGVCVLIPVVGQIAVMGWLVLCFWGRQNQEFENFPAFDFNQFGTYLERGIWPFLVVLVGTLAMMPVIFVVMIPMVLLAGMTGGPNDDTGGWVSVLVCLGIFLFYLLFITTMMLVMTPLKVRASIVQEFGKSFSFSFVKQFIALTWMESMLVWLFMFVASIGFMLVGLMAFCIGLYFVTVPLYFAWAHLSKQLYALYLRRGGEPVAFSPKFGQGPPPLPVG